MFSSQNMNNARFYIDLSQLSAKAIRMEQCIHLSNQRRSQIVVGGM